MPNIDLDQLKDWLQLPDTELRDKLQELIPYRPENLFLAPATHPEYGEVHVISVKADEDEEVRVVILDDNVPPGAYSRFVPLDSLTFTKPAEPVVSPVKPAHPEWLETEQDYKDVPAGTICAEDGYSPVIRFDTGIYYYTGNQCTYRARDVAGTRRRVLRWKWGNDD